MSIDTLSTQFTSSYNVLQANLAGLTHEDSLKQPAPAGNCLNWVAGHLMSSRQNLLGVLGSEKVWSEQEKARYERGSAPLTDPAEAKPLAEILAAIERSQPLVLAGLRRLTPERLAEPAPFSPGGRDDETVASLLATFAFHESYHVGQTGLLRRLAGSDGAIA